MILSDLKNYIESQGRVSMQDMVLRFNTEPDAIRGMLQKWIHKGRIRQTLAGGSACGTGCCQCDPLLTELYEWIKAD